MTIKQAIGKLGRLQSLLATQSNKILLTPTKSIERVMKERIFINGINSDENPIGIGYSKRWAAARKSKGLQTNFVDMKFTGSLRKNLTTKVASSNGVAIMIDNDFDYKEKALKQENLREFYIFSATSDEVDKLEKFVEKALEFQIDKLLT
jgi:hypothetical protein